MFSSNSNNSNSKQSASDFLASNNKYSLTGPKQTDTSWMFPKQASLSVPAPNISFQQPKVPDFSAPKMPDLAMPKASAPTPFLGQDRNITKPSFPDIKSSMSKVPAMSEDFMMMQEKFKIQQENFKIQQEKFKLQQSIMENNRISMEMNLANMRNRKMDFEQVKNRMPSMDDLGENFASSYEGRKTISKLKEWHLGLEKARMDKSFYEPSIAASKDSGDLHNAEKSSVKVAGKKFRGLEAEHYSAGRITPRRYAKLLFGDDKIDNKLVINQQGIQKADKETKEFSEYLNSFVDGNLSQEQKHQRELRAEINEMIRNHPYKLRGKNQLEEGVVNSLVIGAGRAYVEVGQGAKQFAMEIGEKVGIVDANAVQKYSEFIAREKELYALTPVAKSTAGKAGEFAGNTVIFSAVPGGSGLKGYKLAASSAASGAVFMGLHPVERGQGLCERGRNAAVGAAAAVVVVPAVGKVAEVSNQAIVRLYERVRTGILYRGVSNGAATSANLANLTKELEVRTLKSVFNKDGTLTKSAIEDAKILQKISRYNDKSPVKIELAKRGNIDDWVKARTQKFHTGFDSIDVSASNLTQTGEVHFYKNVKTGEVYYDKDYKVKLDATLNPHMPVNAFLSQLSKSWRPGL